METKAIYKGISYALAVALFAVVTFGMLLPAAFADGGGVNPDGEISLRYCVDIEGKAYYDKYVDEEGFNACMEAGGEASEEVPATPEVVVSEAADTSDWFIVHRDYDEACTSAKSGVEIFSAAGSDVNDEAVDGYHEDFAEVGVETSICAYSYAESGYRVK